MKPLLLSMLVIAMLLLGACEARFTPLAEQPTEKPEPVGARTATLVVAAFNSSATSKAQADYVCDGIGDQVEINTALDSGIVGVQLLEGTYNITAQISMGTGDSLTGLGASSVLEVPDGTNGTFSVIILKSVNYCKISNLYIDGNRDNQRDGDQIGITIDAGGYHKIMNLWICNLYGSRGDGIYVAHIPTGVLIEGLTINNIQDDGLDINFLTKSQIIGCYIAKCGDNGIDTEKATYNSYTANVIYTCGGAGIELEHEGEGWSEYCTVNGNTISNCGHAGVLIHNGRYNSVVGNTLENNEIGVRIRSQDEYYSTHNVISGNVISGGTYGIKEKDENQDYNLICGNVVAGATVKSIQINGEHTSVYGNIVSDNK